MPAKAATVDDLSELAENADVNRKLSIFKHRKKQAASDAQLLMNRIALLQKEEERGKCYLAQSTMIYIYRIQK